MYISPTHIHKNRRFTHSAYRYAFNSMEKDDEVKGGGNSYDFGARMYDSRLGRWLSIDRIFSKYPYASTYCFAVNTPIQARDPDGNYVFFVNGYYNAYGGNITGTKGEGPYWGDKILLQKGKSI
jgi:RHS repeat-associated protein